MEQTNDKQVADLYRSGKTQRQVASELGLGIKAVRNSLRRSAIVGRSDGMTNRFDGNRYIFDVIDSEEKAYWLGFLLADGCLAESAGTRRQIRISLKASDIKHLKKLAKFFGYRNKLHSDNRGGHPRLTIVFNCREIGEALISKGWMEYKNSGDIKIMNHIPVELFRHFLRGYYDGDGCISCGGDKKSYYVSIVCKHKKPLELFAKKIYEFGAWDSIKTPKLRRSRKDDPLVHELIYNGRKKLRILLDWMYENSVVYLDRKYSRLIEFGGVNPYSFTNIHNFKFIGNSDDMMNRRDFENIKRSFCDELIRSGWAAPQYVLEDDYALCRSIDTDNYIKDDSIMIPTGIVPGNKIVLHFNPKIWFVSQNKKLAIGNFQSSTVILQKAISNFLSIPNRPLTPERLIREMLFAGYTRASITSVGAFIAAIKKFNLSGIWWDPCAGWGNRLLAAHICDIEYHATDLGMCYSGLERINEKWNCGAQLQNKKWQEAEWPKYDFIMTSIPFHNKEDYLDGVDYGEFDDWYMNFVCNLINKSATRMILHVDKTIKDRLISDYSCNVIPLMARYRHKAPTEFFVEIVRPILSNQNGEWYNRRPAQRATAWLKGKAGCAGRAG